LCINEIWQWVGGEATAQDLEIIWDYIKSFGLRLGAKMCGRKAAEKWLKEDTAYCAWLELNCV